MLNIYIREKFESACKDFEHRRESFDANLRLAESNGIDSLMLLAAQELLALKSHQNLVVDLSAYIACEQEFGCNDDLLAVKRMLSAMEEIIAAQTELVYQARLTQLDKVAAQASKPELENLCKEWSNVERLSEHAEPEGLIHYREFAQKSADMCRNRLRSKFGTVK